MPDSMECSLPGPLEVESVEWDYAPPTFTRGHVQITLSFPYGVPPLTVRFGVAELPDLAMKARGYLAANSEEAQKSWRRGIAYIIGLREDAMQPDWKDHPEAWASLAKHLVESIPEPAETAPE